jgi:hypothetical protein
MTALVDYFKRAQELAGEELLGLSVPLTGAAAQTATASSLAFGGNSEQQFAQWWLWRPTNTVAAEHDRQIDSWVPGTGVFTHSGGAYTDTTATGETLYLTPQWCPPRIVRKAINLAVQQVREWDEEIIPVVRGQEWHWLHELDWIQDAASIRDVFWNYCPVITRNRYLQKRHTVNTSGVLTPDDWTASNNAAGTLFEETTYRGQKYYYALSRSTTDAALAQEISALRTGVSGDFPVGETITAVAVVQAGAIANLKLRINGDAGTTNATADAIEEVSHEYTLTAAQTAITTQLIAQTTDTDHIVWEVYTCIGALTDQIRRDNFPRYMLHDYKFEQGGPLKIHNPHVGSPGQLIICSERPFPGFDATRLGTGAADADESDAPLVPVAVGTVAILLEQHLGKTHPESMAWRRKFESAILKHLSYPTEGGHGKKVLNPPFAAAAGRIR